MDQVLENLKAELRRGTQVFAVLKLLYEEQYGYALLQKLSERNINIEPGTLYPLLRRLEQQELLTSSWDETEPRARKYYKISEYGIKVLEELTIEWNIIVNDLKLIMEENND